VNHNNKVQGDGDDSKHLEKNWNFEKIPIRFNIKIYIVNDYMVLVKIFPYSELTY
jgi:hypothetical protein